MRKRKSSAKLLKILKNSTLIGYMRRKAGLTTDHILLSWNPSVRTLPCDADVGQHVSLPCDDVTGYGRDNTGTKQEGPVSTFASHNRDALLKEA